MPKTIPTIPQDSFRNKKIPIKRPNTWQNNKWLSIFVTLFLMLLVFGSAAYVAYRSEKQKQLQKYANIEPQATIVPPKNILPTKVSSNNVSKKYINTKFKYELSYPSDWQLMHGSSDQKVSIENSDNVNFRKVSDQTPAESGFSIIVNSGITQTASKVCETTNSSNPEPQGFLCSKTITPGSYLIGTSKWEKLPKDQIAYPPTGYVQYDIVNNGNLYVVYNWTAKESDINQILSTFQFTNQ